MDAEAASVPSRRGQYPDQTGQLLQQPGIVQRANRVTGGAIRALVLMLGS
jgi:hypothetical protein